MDKNNIINSGQLEAYCLGQLSIEDAQIISNLAEHDPDIKNELDQIISALESYPDKLTPNPKLKTKVLDFLSQHLHHEEIDLSNPPLLNKYSDVNSWSKAVQNFSYHDDASNLQVENIFLSKNKELNLIWLQDEIIEDAHENDQFKESFLILEGACECDFEGIIVRFKAGDYFEVPSNTKHTIRNISGPGLCVKGLVQRISA